MASSQHMDRMAHTCTFSHCSVVSTSLIFPFRFLFADKRRRLTEGIFTVFGFFSTQYQIICSFHVESSFFSSRLKTNCKSLSFQTFYQVHLLCLLFAHSLSLHLLVPVIPQAVPSTVTGFLSYASPGLFQVLIPLLNSRSECMIATQKYSPGCLLNNACLSCLNGEFLSPNPPAVTRQATEHTPTLVSEIPHSCSFLSNHLSCSRWASLVSFPLRSL